MLLYFLRNEKQRETSLVSTNYLIDLVAVTLKGAHNRISYHTFPPPDICTVSFHAYIVKIDCVV
jgi:hypothetical protein